MSGCIYKNKGSMNHCAKEGHEGHYCPGSGAFLKCYTPCKFCFNSRVYKPTDEEVMSPSYIYLTDDNDFSSITMAYEDTRRIMFSSGSGIQPRIEAEEYTSNGWATVAVYYPKYCPECGRRLNEYEQKDNIIKNDKKNDTI